MKFRIPLAIAALTVTGVLVGPASPVSAEPVVTNTTADTTTTFTLTGGSLTMTVQGTAALGDSTTGDMSITGLLGEVSVNDPRGGTAGWVVSAASTTFTGGTPAKSSTAVRYTSGTPVTTGTSIVAGSTSADITAEVSVVTATGVSGNNTATWTPTLDVTMPASALVGLYSGTVTTSVV